MPRPRSRVRYEMAVPRPPARLAPRVIPSVDPWVAGEMFVSPHVEERRRGFAILLGSETVRRSNLTIQLLCSRVDEPDLALRAQIVQALADYFEVRGLDYRYPAEVRAVVAGHLRKYERPHLLALLELHHAARTGQVRLAADALPRLLERVPNASAQLVKLAGDRSLALKLRREAIELIGRVGFTDAKQALQGLEARIAGRRAGQIPMTFAPSDHADEQQLLPVLRITLQLLNEIE
ncbi:MAG: hypothetical protein NZM11_09095 [Anaerolineales bacterium]|nr:hypothetical protein [Anaerolineales bacterium]